MKKLTLKNCIVRFSPGQGTYTVEPTDVDSMSYFVRRANLVKGEFVYYRYSPCGSGGSMNLYTVLPGSQRALQIDAVIQEYNDDLINRLTK